MNLAAVAGLAACFAVVDVALDEDVAHLVIELPVHALPVSLVELPPFFASQ